MGARASTRLLAVTVALFLALCLVVLSGAASNAQTLPPEVDFEPGEIIVKLVDEADIEAINTDYGTQVKDTFPDAFPDGENIYLLKVVDENQSAEDVLEEMQDEIRNGTSSRLVYAELNLTVEAPEAAARHRAFPNDGTKPSRDKYSSKRYSKFALNLSSAHDVSTGRNTTVAVLDTGAQLGHRSLEENFKVVAGLDHDLVSDDKDPSEPRFAQNKQRRKNEVVGHGTHVAGIVDLVAPDAEIMPLRVLNRKGYGNVFYVAKAVIFAKDHGADVINLSLGTPDPTVVGLAPPELLRETVDEAIDEGVVVAAAAGNVSTEPPALPSAYYPAARGTTADPDDGLLAVTSVNCREQKSKWANYGPWVDIAAPGEGIRSAYPVSTYARWSGTSMATPFVAGQAALIRSVDEDLEPALVEVQIRDSARPLAEDPLHIIMGAGHTDVGASLGRPGPPPELCPSSQG